MVWVENTKGKIITLLQVFKRYPPLTTRLQRQLAFLERMLVLTRAEKRKAVVITTYFAQRELKYPIAEQRLIRDPAKFHLLPYYKEWLSGFIEAEGCFSVRANKTTPSFSVGQKFDSDLLRSIRGYLKTAANVNQRKSERNFYYFETYNRAALLKIIRHCQQYPLLGEKAEQFTTFASFILRVSKVT